MLFILSLKEKCYTNMVLSRSFSMNKNYEISVFKQPYLKSGTLAKKGPYMLCDDTGNVINENAESKSNK